MGRQLGIGAYALVKQCYHKKTKINAAMKIYDKYKLTDAARKKSVQREIYLLKRIQHPNICGFFDSFDTRNTVR
jgi:doublecortin-like kinase 3